MPANFVNARYALYSATEISTADLSAATYLGALAPGTSIGEPDVATADGFGRKLAVAASQDITVVTYGSAAEAALATAAIAAEPPDGYLYIVNGSKTRADKFKVNVVSSEVWPVVDDDSRARVRYQFYANSDTVADYHDTVEGAILFAA